MTTLSHPSARPATAFVALVGLTAAASAFQGRDVTEMPAPSAPPAGTTQELVEQTGPVPGERLDASAIGPVVIEDMAAVLRRQAERGPENGPGPKARNGAQGEWEVPGPRWIRNPHSGTRYVINRWGDTRMGIGFGEEIDLVGTWVVGQGTEGSWTSGLQAVGYRDGREVARTGWFEDVGAEPTWFEIALEDVDRVELVARPAVRGAGWYALDDLTFVVADRQVVLDFEDVDHRSVLTGSGYAGLDWEVGTGDFDQQAEVMPPPRTLPDQDLAEGQQAPGAGMAKLGGGGTSPTLVEDFDGPRLGNPGAGFVPPDTVGAVGPDHFVASVNANLSVYEKTTKNRVVNVSLGSFWNSSATFGDPRVAYDPAHDRWVVIATNFNDRVWFAYSQTNDPTGAWLKTSVIVRQGADANKWPDYPTLGVDDKGVYFAAGMFSSGATMSIFAVDKGPLLSGTMGAVTAWRSIPWEKAIQPCVTYGNSGGVYLVGVATTTRLRLRQITGMPTSPSLNVIGQPITPAWGLPPSAPQKGTNAKLDTLDARLMNAVYRNGSVWTTHCVSIAGRAGILWYEIDAPTATTLQAGTVSDSSLHFYMPGISVNAKDEMLLGFSGSDATTFAGTYLTGRVPSDPADETGVPLLYHAGEGAYTVQTSTGTNRWGDYSLTSVDPVDDETFYTIQEYAGATNFWATRIGVAAFDCGVSTYCTSKITSKFCAPTMTSTGSPSLSLGMFFDIRAQNMDAKVNGIMFWSLTGPASIPFQGGTLCVGSPLYRLPGRNSGGTTGCTGTIGYSLAEIAATNPGAQIVPGSRIWIQTWARDTGDAFGSSLSDGLTFEVCP